MDIIEPTTTHVLALIAGAVATRVQESWRRKRRDHEALAAAASVIVAELRSLTIVVTKTRDITVETAELIETWRTCAVAIAEHQHRLPPAWAHLRRSIRSALGELFGGPSWADVSYGEEIHDVVEFDAEWWDHAVTYFEYVTRRLAAIADRPESAGRAELLDFDSWLAVTGRHGEPSPRSRGTRKRLLAGPR